MPFYEYLTIYDYLQWGLLVPGSALLLVSHRAKSAGLALLALAFFATSVLIGVALLFSRLT